jgi:CubicO group peptidase (beta-lactamase class C family)
MKPLMTPSPAEQRSRFAAAYQVLSDGIAAHAFPGCAFGVLAAGNIVLVDALGHFTYDADSPRVAPYTVFDVASLTKVVATTSMAMLLHQRGQLFLDTPLGHLLPEFLVGRPTAEHADRVTLRHLLAHNSGLPGYIEFFRTAKTPDELLRACLSLPLTAEPGTRAEYSDPGFILLGNALEHIAHEPLASWTRREVFQPLAMAATGFCPSPAARPTIPPTEDDTTFRMRRIQGEVQDENASILHGVAGHAGLFSTVPELLTFAQAILPADAKTEIGVAKPLLFAAETVNIFAQRQGPAGSSCALGWDTPSDNSTSGKYFSQHSIGHLAYSGCSLWIDLDAAISVVLLTNRTWPDRRSQLIREVRPAFHNALREKL